MLNYVNRLCKTWFESLQVSARAFRLRYEIIKRRAECGPPYVPQEGGCALPPPEEPQEEAQDGRPPLRLVKSQAVPLAWGDKAYGDPQVQALVGSKRYQVLIGGRGGEQSQWRREA